MKVVILAAGKGVRMMPLTENTPKALVNVAGKPFLYHVLEKVKKAGLTEVGLVVNYKKEKIAEFVDSYEGLNITLIEQKEMSGTGTAVLAAKDYVGDENFIVMMGDNLYSSSDLKNLSDKKEDVGYVAPYVSGHPKDYGVLTIEGDQLIRTDEKPENPASNLVNTGLYRFTSEVFPLLEKLEKSPRGEYEITDAINVLAGQGKMKVYVLKEYWIDMSSIDRLHEVEADVMSVV